VNGQGGRMPGLARTMRTLLAALVACGAGPASAWWPAPAPNVVAPSTWSGANPLAQSIETWALDRLGRRLHLDSASLSLQGGLTLEGLRLDDRSGRAQLTAKRVEADYSMRSLFMGSRDVVAVRVVEPKVSLVRDGNGSFDVDDMLARWNSSATGPPAPLPDCAVSGGAIDVTDRASGATWRVGALALTTHSSTVTAGEVQVTHVRAELAGGQLSGQLTLGAGPTRFDVVLEGASLAQLLKMCGTSSDRASGSVTVAFQGRGAIPHLTGTGTASFPELVIDVSRSEAVQSGRRMVREGRAAGGALALVLGTNPIGIAMLAGATQSNYYSRLLDELSQPHRLRKVKAHLKAGGGQLTVGPITGPDLAGHLTLGQSSRSVDGAFSLLRLGAAEIRGIAVSGTLNAPTTRVDLKRVTLNGKPAPVNGTAGVGGMIGTSAGAIRGTVESVPRGVGRVFNGLFH